MKQAHFWLGVLLLSACGTADPEGEQCREVRGIEGSGLQGIQGTGLQGIQGTGRQSDAPKDGAQGAPCGQLHGIEGSGLQGIQGSGLQAAKVSNGSVRAPDAARIVEQR